MEQQNCKQRSHKVFSDYGISDYYKSYKKLNKDIDYDLYKKVLNGLLGKISDVMSNSMYDLKLPYGLGKIIVRKFEPKLKYDENGNPSMNVAIDWKGTNELWRTNPELRKVQYVYHLNEHSMGYRFAIMYKKSGCMFKNRLFYALQVNRKIKRSTAGNIKSGEFDALEINTK